MYTHRLWITLIVTSLVALSAWGQTTMVEQIPVEKRNANYPSNRAPLAPQRLIKLPTGSIKPSGWLLTQLELQEKGLCGHLGEISAWLQREDNAWLKQGGKWGWEEVPYWLRGYSDMAILMQNKDMMKEAKTWIDAILLSQREDGNFGPYTLVKGAQDFWPNMIVLWTLQTYYEATQDSRILPFMTKYFKFQLTVPDDKFLQSYWENSRGGDNLWSVIWLYNRTGDAELLKLAEKIHRNTADWTNAQQLPNWHNVNIAQSFREPATYSIVSKDSAMLRASYNVQRLVRKTFGQVPGGMFGSDENARMGYIDPRQATETCGFVEQMASDEIMLLITGDAYWAENCEDVAFNSYPASFMPDYRSLRYLTSPNMVVSDCENHAPGVFNDGPFLAMNPFSSRCCQHNHSFGWPYYAEHLVLATPDNGLAVALYGACSAKAQVADGKEVVLTETTNYPFEETVTFKLQTKRNVSFPLYLRIPNWTNGAVALVNGAAVETSVESGKYLRIEREWKDGDQVVLTLPMQIKKRHWQVNNNSVSVDYGPLTLSLLIGERYALANSTSTAHSDAKWQKNADQSKWPTFEIHPTTPWNFALCSNNPIRLVERKHLVDHQNPFTLENVPLIFEATGRLVPSWKIDQYGLCGVLPYEDEPRSSEVSTIRLVPMGAARLRISAFPDAQ